jgi:hypothetical protein
MLAIIVHTAIVHILYTYVVFAFVLCGVACHALNSDK